jgi:hypothetical protein
MVLRREGVVVVFECFEYLRRGVEEVYVGEGWLRLSLSYFVGGKYQYILWELFSRFLSGR